MIIKENINRFSQTKGMPLTDRLLMLILGHCGETHSAVQVLHGTFNVPKNTPKYMRKFLEMLAGPTEQPQKPNIDKLETSKAWAKQRDNMSSEPSAPSYGQFKASSCDQYLNKVDSLISLPQLSHLFPSNLGKDGTNRRAVPQPSATVQCHISVTHLTHVIAVQAVQ